MTLRDFALADMMPDLKPYYGNAELAALFAAQECGEAVHTQRDTDALKYVDAIHSGVALITRPLAVDLMKVMARPNHAMSLPFSMWTPPERYAPENASSPLKEKALIQPLASSRVIGVMPSLMAMHVWFAGYGMPLRASKIDLEDFPFRKALVLGFEQAWHVLPLQELSLVGNAKFAAPQRIYRAYKTRENAMKAAQDYVALGKLTKRCIVPPELMKLYQEGKPLHDAHEAYWAEYRRLHAEGERILNPSANEPEKPEHWHF